MFPSKTHTDTPTLTEAKEMLTLYDIYSSNTSGKVLEVKLHTRIWEWALLSKLQGQDINVWLSVKN